MITHYFRTLKDSELKILDQPRTGVWTHAESPTEEEIAYLTGEYGLNQAIMEDAQDPFEVPRLERSGSVTYFFTRYPDISQPEDIETAPLLIAVGESFVLTVSLTTPPPLASFFNGETAVATTQKSKFFIELMTAVIKAYETKLVGVRRVVQKNRTLLRRVGSKEIVRLVHYEHELNDMVAALVPTNVWLARVSNESILQLYSEDKELMEDLSIATNQLVDSARSVLKSIQNVRNAAEAILTSKLNTTIRTLTVLTILLTIPTIVSSLYGMNIPLPFSDHPLAFAFVLGGILFLVSVSVLLFKRYHWL